MPFLRLSHTAAGLSEQVLSGLHRSLLDAMTTIMGKKRHLTSILIEAIDPKAGHWFVGDEARPVAAHLEAIVTQGTNSADQKAHFIAQAHAAMQEAFGAELSPATYVVVREVPGENWGYAGITQAERAGVRAP